ncbi:zinc finger MYM-type protein 5-like isoform X2 [Gopherus flavomarginatus]|nr:zinc finger MYM-type protein 5-like isoform X2 [Gopherus flavomarginatus]
MQEEKGKITFHKFLQAQSKSSQLTELSDAGIQGSSEVGSESGVVREKEKAMCEKSKILPHSENNVMVVAEEEKEIQSLWIDNGEHSGNTAITEKLVQLTSPAAVDGNNEEELCSNDPAYWKYLDIKKRDLIILKGPPHKPKNFPHDSFDRKLPITFFSKPLSNGKCIERDWMVWSKDAAAIFCFPCSLYRSETQTNQLHHSNFVEDGTVDSWKKIYKKIKSHEENALHLSNYFKWKELFQTSLIKEALMLHYSIVLNRRRKNDVKY